MDPFLNIKSKKLSNGYCSWAAIQGLQQQHMSPTHQTTAHKAWVPTATIHVAQAQQHTSKTAYEYTAATPTATACIIQHSICSITFPATMIHIQYNGVQLRPNLVHCLSSAVSARGRTVLGILNDADW